MQAASVYEEWLSRKITSKISWNVLCIPGDREESFSIKWIKITTKGKLTPYTLFILEGWGGGKKNKEESYYLFSWK